MVLSEIVKSGMVDSSGIAQIVMVQSVDGANWDGGYWGWCACTYREFDALVVLEFVGGKFVLGLEGLAVATPDG